MRPLKRIMLILLVVLLLPALFFSVYEISSLSSDEEMLRNIYDKQLDAILFSANQYADDVTNSWLKGVEATSITGDSLSTEFDQLLQFNASIKHVLLADTLPSHSVVPLHYKATADWKSIEKVITKRLDQEDSIVHQLGSLHRSGFQKIEALPINTDSSTDEIMLLFYLNNPRNNYVLGIFIIDTDGFIDQVLGPKLLQIAQEQFVLTVFQKFTGEAVYSTVVPDTSRQVSFAIRKTLWLLPSYELAIGTTGKSLQAIIDERMYTNLVLIIILDLTILIGIWLIFKNVKKEVQLAQSKSDFVSNVSHEIRTPLSLISMFAETLLDGRVKNLEKRNEYYGIIHKESQRLTAIINKILSFSQLDAEKRTLEVEPVELNALTKEILNTYEYHLSNSGFTWQLVDQQLVTVMADKNALEEILINLIDNAIKYSADKRHLEISIGHKGPQGFVSIADRGVGISKDDISFIFDKFYRAYTGDLAKKKGTGLGLTLVHQLVKKHGGEVIVQSEPNKGSVFTVYLPRALDIDA